VRWKYDRDEQKCRTGRAAAMKMKRRERRTRRKKVGRNVAVFCKRNMRISICRKEENGLTTPGL
jgi:hypothetical protein